VPFVDDASVLVAPDRLVGLFGLEVGGGGVEEDQVDFQVEQVRHGVEHPAGQLVLHGDEPVHGAVAGVVGHLRKSGQVHVVGDPRGGGQLRGRRERPVGDQREQHPLHHGIPAGAGGQAP
jgi:hypothetical protein